MMSRMPPFRSLLMVVAACALFHPVGTRAEPPVRTTMLTYAPFGLPEGFTAFFESQGVVRPFSASAATLGVPIPHSGPRRLILRRNGDEFQLPPDQLAATLPLAVIDLPENADMVVIIAVPQQEGAVRFMAHDVSANTLRRGGYKVFNFSSHPLMLSLGGQGITLAPGRNTTLEGGRWGDQVSALPLMIATRVDGEARPAYSGYWEHYPQRRQLFFLFDGKHPSEPVVFSSFNAGKPPPASAPE